GRGAPVMYSAMPKGWSVSGSRNSTLLYPVSSHGLAPVLVRMTGTRATSSVPPPAMSSTPWTFAGWHGGAEASVASAGRGSGSGLDGVGTGGDEGASEGVDEAVAGGAEVGPAVLVGSAAELGPQAVSRLAEAASSRIMVRFTPYGRMVRPVGFGHYSNGQD